MKLVINADDLGYSTGINHGIIEGYRNGCISSTTALTNGEFIEEAVQMCKENPGLAVGVHLTLTLGKPLTNCKTLVDEDGNFFKGRTTVWSKNPDYDEIYNEWKAQIERYIELFGHKPSHLDSHHSVHDATEQAKEVSLRLAKEYGLELRRYGRFKFVPGFFGPTATRENLIEILKQHQGEDIEIMSHSGYCDLYLYRISSYSLDRVKELDVLCSEELKNYIKENDIELCHY